MAYHVESGRENFGADRFTRNHELSLCGRHLLARWEEAVECGLGIDWVLREHGLMI